MEEFIPLIDVCLVTVDEYHIRTAEEYNAEPVIQEGEKQDLINKGELLANLEQPTILKGYDLKFKDCGLRPKLMEKLMGGTYTAPTASEGFKYKGPKVGALKPTKIAKVSVYTKEVRQGGETGEYVKVSYTGCLGDLVTFGFKDGEWFASEFTIKSRPTQDQDAFDMEMVSELPAEPTL